ncbi:MULTISPECIES: class I SAM-dependent methyltransferase [unclassified Streptomyces]|uniref:class I SAM-dependent methyltransferase n=1 Tax=unclassified Streptomyces TaxID=2593676 RepID=UPI0036E055E7
MTHPTPAPHGSPAHSQPHGHGPHEIGHGAHDSHGHGAPAHESHGAPAHEHEQDGLAELLDLDAELFAPYIEASMRSIAEAAGDDVKRIVDLGAGSGTGTFALLKQFPSARVTAVDSSAHMLEQLTRTAAAKNLDSRVHALEADAGTSLPGVADADLVWASASMHHMNDPMATLGIVFEALRPGGFLAIAELDGMPRFLADDAVPQRPGLERRCREALTTLHDEEVPHMGADWGALLASAGFTLEEERAESLELRPQPGGSAGLYAHGTLSRIRGALAGRIDPADLEALDTLVNGGPADVRRRDDLVVRSTRELWIARRPTDSGS